MGLPLAVFNWRTSPAAELGPHRHANKGLGWHITNSCSARPHDIIVIGTAPAAGEDHLVFGTVVLAD